VFWYHQVDACVKFDLGAHVFNAFEFAFKLVCDKVVSKLC
jgi:hypothetical protein